MRIAFKEWALVVAALGGSEPIIMLRNDGTSEGRGGFRPAPARFRPEWFAEVVAVQRLDSPAAVERLRGRQVWREEVITARFDGGRDGNLHALPVRVHRLPGRVDLPKRPVYGRCQSWVELEPEVEMAGAKPGLSDEAVAEKLNQFRAALELIAPA